jgi:O-antigen/teichoic acid export membrane protein
MSTIRKQSIISSVVVYIGFALGFLNTYLFTRQGGLTKEEFGLTNTFLAFASIMFSVANLGMPAYIVKFFPYYKSHVPDKKNDQLSWSLLITCIGFLLVLIAGVAFKGILIDKIFNNSPELPKYYYWTFLFGFGYTLFMIFEPYAWQQRKAVLSNFLKEVLFRLFVSALILLVTFGAIKTFNDFIGIYSFTYLIIALILILYFVKIKQLHLTLNVSIVTKKFFKKIVALAGFVWGGSLVFNVANVFDTIVIAAVAPNGMAAVAIYSLAQNISSLMQAPQRAIISAAVGPLSQAWKAKDYNKIDMIYHRSSINQLIFSCAMFCLIWLNFNDGIDTFHLQAGYKDARWIFFYIGIYKIIDMGTGLNSQIIGTSTFWRFEFISGLVLFTFTLPLNYELTRHIGLIGPAISSLIGFTVYNLIRFIFLYRKFKMQPFTSKTLYTLLLAAGCYYISWLLFNDYSGLIWIFLRSTVFVSLFVTGMFLLNLSPDVRPVLTTLMKRLRLNH